MATTRREKLERKLHVRLAWAEGASKRSVEAYDAARRIADLIPIGQPILTGHHSEGSHVRDVARIDRETALALEQSRLAQHHARKAEGIERMLESCVFSDDYDAIERLERRIAENEREAELLNACNRAWRESGIDGVRAVGGEDMARRAEETMRLAPWLRAPFDAGGLRSAIRRDRRTIERLRGGTHT